MEMISYLINSICWIIGFTSALILLIAGMDYISKKAESKFKAFCCKNIFVQAWLNSDKESENSSENRTGNPVKERQSCGLVLSESPVVEK